MGHGHGIGTLHHTRGISRNICAHQPKCTKDSISLMYSVEAEDPILTPFISLFRVKSRRSSNFYATLIIRRDYGITPHTLNVAN